MDTPALVLLAALAVVVVVGAVVCRRLQAQVRSCRDEIASLRARVDELDRTPALDRHDDFVITALPVTPEPAVDAAPVGAAFVSVAAGESLVRVISLAYGVRRALSPENRNRIGFEMRREVKRARKQRRRDVREAQQYLRKEAA